LASVKRGNSATLRSVVSLEWLFAQSREIGETRHPYQAEPQKVPVGAVVRWQFLSKKIV
jgi:hypothetical protein